MKYKVTTRGWFVFSIIGIIVLFGLYTIGSKLFVDDPVESDDVSIQEPSNVADDESNDVTEGSPEDDIVDTGDDVDDTEAETESPSDDETTDDETEDETAENDETEKEPVDMDRRLEILFDKNIADLNETYFALLDEWVTFLSTNNEISVTIEGHINGFPYYEDGDYGKKIAEDRATVVYNYLVEQGVNPSRIRLLNMGSSLQVTMSEDKSEHYLNRRAIIYITKD